MIRRPPRSTRTDTLFPSTPLFRAGELVGQDFGVEQRFVVRHLAQRPDGDRIVGGDEAQRLQPGAFHPLGDQHAERLVRVPSLEGIADHIMHRSEEHTSELQSLMRISYAVFCWKKKTNTSHTN